MRLGPALTNSFSLARLASVAVTAFASVLLTTSSSAASDADEPPTLEFAFEAVVNIEPPKEIGPTPYGMRRRIAITGGSVSGPRLHGKVLPGGADWQLQRADDYTVLEADYMLQADDGTLIHVVNRGLSNSRVAGEHPRYVRTVPVFEAPNGPFAWLNQSVFVATLDALPGKPVPAVRLRFFRVR